MEFSKKEIYTRVLTQSKYSQITVFFVQTNTDSKGDRVIEVERDALPIWGGRHAARGRTRAARSAETGENRVGAAGTRRRSAAENLGQINIAVLIQRHADADLGTARA